MGNWIGGPVKLDIMDTMTTNPVNPNGKVQEKQPPVEEKQPPVEEKQPPVEEKQTPRENSVLSDDHPSDYTE